MHINTQERKSILELETEEKVADGFKLIILRGKQNAQPIRAQRLDTSAHTRKINLIGTYKPTVNCTINDK
jgi:hypothetical protein